MAGVSLVLAFIAWGDTAGGQATAADELPGPPQSVGWSWSPSYLDQLSGAWPGSSAVIGDFGGTDAGSPPATMIDAIRLQPESTLLMTGGVAETSRIDNLSSLQPTPSAESLRLYDEGTATAVSPSPRSLPDWLPFRRNTHFVPDEFRAGDERGLFPRAGEPITLGQSPEPFLQTVGLPGTGTFSGRIRGEYGEDFDDLTQTGGQLVMTVAGKFAFDAEAYQRRIRPAVGGSRTIWTGDANVVYRLTQNARWNFRTGIGASWLDERGDGDLEGGVNFTYGFDAFIKPPFLVSGEMDYGWIGDDKLFHARLTGGFVWGVLEFYGGHEWYDVGQHDFDVWIAGVGLWF